jgi:DNA-directed RNA polymerase specialized sigma24 family protein
VERDRRWARARVAAVLEAMAREPHAPRGHSLADVLRLQFEAGMNVRDIAAAWHEPAGHVHELRRRAFRRFRRLLGPLVVPGRASAATDHAAGATLLALFD